MVSSMLITTIAGADFSKAWATRISSPGSATISVPITKG